MFKGLGQLGDMAKLMKQAQEMQQKMLDAQSELDNIEVIGEAGGGLVKVVATAKGNFKNIEIDESILIPSEKQVIEDLEAMGGFSEENRNQLIERYKEERKNLNPLEFGKRSELTEKIRFLEEGKYGYGKGTKFFDFDNLEQLTELSDVDKLMLNFDPNYDPTAGMRKNKKNGNGVNVVEMPGETIKLKGNK